MFGFTGLVWFGSTFKRVYSCKKVEYVSCIKNETSVTELKEDNRKDLPNNTR